MMTPFPESSFEDDVHGKVLFCYSTNVAKFMLPGSPNYLGCNFAQVNQELCQPCDF